MDVRLFGEMRLDVAGEPLDVGAPQQQAVLAALVIDAPAPVSVETLVDRVWAEAPPAEARNVLYSHVSRIRRLLRRAAAAEGRPVARLERRYAGYALEVDPEVVDVHRFRRLVAWGGSPERTDVDRAGALAEAVGLWCGVPLAGIAGRWAEGVREGLHRLRLDAYLGWAGAQLRLGQPDAVIARLPDLVAEYPLAEPLEVLLLRALRAVGRDAEAVGRYAGVRERLADTLGADPGPDLRALHQAMLRGEPPPAIRAAPAPAGPPPVAVPAQLPPDVAAFAGREDELRRLDRLLGAATGDAAAGRAGNTVVITAIDGTAGIGKTALAVHWAHRSAGRFGDGQLYLNLRGFDPSGSPVAPEQAVRGFLDAFGVPPGRIPHGLDAQVGLYRSVLAGRRVLLLLDNARDAEQVRPLLPGAPGCVAVVTSRNRLAGLVAGAGAHPLTVGLPTAAEARGLLAGRVGADRVAAEPAAVDEILARCARLPLALSIVAARAAARPGFALAVFAGELAAAQGRLDEFAEADPAADVRTVFSWSYRLLSPAAARLFRLVGLHPAAEVSAAAAASLAGLRPPAARPVLAELTAAHLLGEPAPGRYGFHDLLRAYAREQAEAADPADERHAALRRLLDHYLHTATAAVLLLDPNRLAVVMAPAHPDVTPERVADNAQALAWFTAEHAVLVAMVHRATAAGFLTHAWQLAWTLSTFLAFRGHGSDGVAVQRVALAAAERLGEPATEALVHHLLGRAHLVQGGLDEAQEHLARAGDLAAGIGDLVIQGQSQRFLAVVSERRGRPAEALAHSRRAAALFGEAHWRPGCAAVLNDIGWYHADLGDPTSALAFCQRALAEYEELDNPVGQATTCDSIGYAHDRLGQYGQAIAYYRRALGLLRQVGDRSTEAVTLRHLGDAHRSAGDPGAARAAWRQAAEILDDLDPVEAGKVRAKLAAGEGGGGRRR